MAIYQWGQSPVGYQQIEVDGVEVLRRRTLNLTGPLTASDDAVNARTDVDIESEAFLPASGDPDRVLLTDGATVPVWGQVSNVHVATAAAIDGAKVSPAFGDQPISGRSLEVNDFVEIGGSPADAGAVRLDNQAFVRARNSAGSDNVDVVAVSDANEVQVGGTNAAGIRLNVGATSVAHALASQFHVGVNTLRVGGSFGSVGAQFGVNLRNVSSLWFRNDGGDGDLKGLSATTSDEIVVGDATRANITAGANDTTVKDGGTTLATFASGLVTSTQPVAVDTGAGTVADAGSIRLADNATIQFRGAGASNVEGLSSASGVVKVGGNNATEVALRIGADSMFSVTSSLAALDTPLAVHTDAGTVASSGAIRLPNDSAVQFKGAGASDVSALSVDGSGVLRLGGANATDVRVRVDTVDALLAAAGLNTSAYPLAVDSGAGTVADAGSIRLPNNATIQFRGAGASNVEGLSSASGVVKVGGNNATEVALNIGSDAVLSVTSSLSSLDTPLAVNTDAGAVASAGTIRLPNNASVQTTHAGSNVTVLEVNNGIIQVGGANASEVALRVGGDTLLSVTDSEVSLARDVEFSADALTWDVGQTPTISQEPDPTSSVTGKTFTIAAQNTTAGAADTGGDLHLRPGSGTMYGELELQDGGGAARVLVDRLGNVVLDAEEKLTITRAGAEKMVVGDGGVELSNDVPLTSNVAAGGAARTLVWEITPPSPGASNVVARLYRHQTGFEITMNASWTGTLWAKDVATNASRLRIEPTQALLHFHNTGSTSFSDASWTGSFTLAPNTGATASMTSSAELTGPGSTQAFIGHQCPKASAGTNTNVGSGCTFRKYFPATPSSVTFSMLTSSGIASGPSAYATTQYGTGAFCGTSAMTSGGTTVWFYTRVYAS